MKNIQIVGFEEIDLHTISIIKQKIWDLVNRHEKIFGENRITDFKLVANKIRKREHPDYEISAHLDTPLGHFRTSKSGWKVLDVTENVLEELERLVIEKKDKIKQF
ncbi:MAG: hypothetical protein J4428_02050 [Candidatus Aenigmarchaeota archaeon]|nr:hypothetical protein [Candidatus Aenigmarchaeota archaeon]